MDPENLVKIITCGICLKIFDEGPRSPRMLSCGHSICLSCVNFLLVKNPKCPTCKTGIIFSSADSIPINFSLDNLIRCQNTVNIVDLTEIDIIDAETNELIASKFQQPEQSNEPHPNDQPKVKKRKLMSEGFCTEHENYNEFRCMDCELWICGTCAALLHKQCRTLLVSEANIELKRGKIFLKGKKLQVKSQKIIKRLNVSLKNVRKGKKMLLEEMQRLEHGLLAHDIRIGQLEAQKEKVNILCEKLKKFQASAKASSANHVESSNAYSEFRLLLEEENMQIRNISHLPLTHEALGILCQSESVYVVDDRHDGILFGKVAVYNERIWVDRFLPEKPGSATLFNFKDLLTRFNRGSIKVPKTVFLELTPIVDDANGDSFANGDAFRIAIETDGTNPRAQNLMFLSSGLKGISYKGSMIHCLSSVCDINSRSLPVVKWLPVSAVEDPTRVVEGGVYGLRRKSSFRIQLRNRAFVSDFPPFGYIIEGIGRLKSKRGKLIVSESGLVI